MGTYFCHVDQMRPVGEELGRQHMNTNSSQTPSSNPRPSMRSIAVEPSEPPLLSAPSTSARSQFESPTQERTSPPHERISPRSKPLDLPQEMRQPINEESASRGTPVRLTSTRSGRAYRKYTRISMEGAWQTSLEKTTLESNLDLPIISSLVYCKSSALDHVATEVDCWQDTRPSKQWRHQLSLLKYISFKRRVLVVGPCGCAPCSLCLPPCLAGRQRPSPLTGGLEGLRGCGGEDGDTSGGVWILFILEMEDSRPSAVTTPINTCSAVASVSSWFATDEFREFPVRECGPASPVFVWRVPE
uniref:Uncharacterized protein n=1 Tax=Timema shepardi TaxID=629360 RepID=A0A7R9G300_TIMSH|nr:unnamed protein product [Timema shepardi]